MYESLLRKITNANFILHLELMCDALQEWSELSEALQHQNVGLGFANEKLKMTAQLFENRKAVPGTYYTHAMKSVQKFSGVLLYKKKGKNSDVIIPGKFYGALKTSIEKRMLSKNDSEVAEWMKVLDEKNWPKNVEAQITYGESEMKNLAAKFKLNERLLGISVL